MRDRHMVKVMEAAMQARAAEARLARVVVATAAAPAWASERELAQWSGRSRRWVRQTLGRSTT